MTIECAQCGSTEFTKLSLVYSQGYSELDGRSRGWGLAFGLEGPAIGLGRAKTRGHLQSKLSESASPPRKKSYWKVIKWGSLLSAMAWWILFYLISVPRGPQTIAGGFLLIAYLNGGLVAFALWIVWRYNRYVFPERYANWNSSFMCRRCGHIAQWAGRIEQLPSVVQEARP